MFRRADELSAQGTDRGGEPAEGELVLPSPHLPGGLDALLNTRPCFRGALRGYDRLQVDNYVAWAESELGTLRRRTDHLLAGFGAAQAELEISRRLLAQS